MSKDREDFLEELHKKGIGMTRIETEMIWQSCCNHALDWLINQERPVDMYFVKLHNSALRSNWKSWVMFRMLRFVYEITSYGKTVGQGYRRLFLNRLLSSPELVMMKDGVIRRSVEVEHTPMWTRIVKRVEKRRLAILNEDKYAAYVMESIKQAVATNKSRLSHWLASVGAPSAKIVYGDNDERPRLVADRPTRLLPTYLVRLNSLFKVVFTDNGRLAEGARGMSGALPSPNVFVQAVPDVRPEDEDLRDNRPDLQQPKDRAA